MKVISVINEIYLGNAGNSSNTYNWDLVTTMGRRLLQSFSSLFSFFIFRIESLR